MKPTLGKGTKMTDRWTFDRLVAWLIRQGYMPLDAIRIALDREEAEEQES